LVLPSCKAYTKEFKASLADEIERNQDNALQVKTIIDYDMICKKLDVAIEDMGC
jgi:hypothetical protein